MCLCVHVCKCVCVLVCMCVCVYVCVGMCVYVHTNTIYIISYVCGSIPDFAWHQMSPFFVYPDIFLGSWNRFPMETRGVVLWMLICWKGAWCHYSSILKLGALLLEGLTGLILITS